LGVLSSKNLKLSYVIVSIHLIALICSKGYWQKKSIYG
jgi:hypothetical protein